MIKKRGIRERIICRVPARGSRNSARNLPAATKEKPHSGRNPDAAILSSMSRPFHQDRREPDHFGMRNSGIGICISSYMFMYCAKSR